MKAADLARVRAAFERQWALLRAWLDTIPAESYAPPSSLLGWSVGDLVVHIGRAVEVLANLDADDPDQEPRPAADYTAGYRDSAEANAEATRASAAAVRDDELAYFDDAWSRAVAALDAYGPADRTVVTRRGPIRLGDLVLLRIVELVVHGDDLVRSLPDLPAPPEDRDAVQLVVKFLLDSLADRAPGRTVEVRVPPYAAVQAVPGPRHTRGTPPNVIETDATTWIRLATGRSTWEDDFAAGRIRASGQRADISEFLPLL